MTIDVKDANNVTQTIQSLDDLTKNAGSADADTVRVVIADDSPGVNALGQTTKAGSVSVTMASDQEIAHDSADSGNPLKMGAKAVAGLSSVATVGAADRTNLYSGLDGALIVRPKCGLEDIVDGNASNTDGTSTQVIAAAGAGIYQHLTKVTLTNTSSSFAYVEMKSGTTVRHTIPLPAQSGATLDFDPPLRAANANEAWNFDPSAATTTIICSAIGFKSKI